MVFATWLLIVVSVLAGDTTVYDQDDSITLLQMSAATGQSLLQQIGPQGSWLSKTVPDRWAPITDGRTSLLSTPEHESLLQASAAAERELALLSEQLNPATPAFRDSYALQGSLIGLGLSQGQPAKQPEALPARELHESANAFQFPAALNSGPVFQAPLPQAGATQSFQRYTGQPDVQPADARLYQQMLASSGVPGSAISAAPLPVRDEQQALGFYATAPNDIIEQSRQALAYNGAQQSAHRNLQQQEYEAAQQQAFADAQQHAYLVAQYAAAQEQAYAAAQRQLLEATQQQALMQTGQSSAMFMASPSIVESRRDGAGGISLLQPTKEHGARTSAAQALRDSASLATAVLISSLVLGVGLSLLYCAACCCEKPSAGARRQAAALGLKEAVVCGNAVCSPEFSLAPRLLVLLLLVVAVVGVVYVCLAGVPADDLALPCFAATLLFLGSCACACEAWGELRRAQGTTRAECSAMREELASLSRQLREGDAEARPGEVLEALAETVLRHERHLFEATQDNCEGGRKGWPHHGAPPRSAASISTAASSSSGAES